jgi:hypothetical protein
MLLLGCGRIDFDPLDPGDGSKSGTRLKLVWNELEDGTRTWRDIYDSVLDQRCTIYPWSDGNRYCVPRDATLAFTDAACTQPLVVVTTNACASAGPAARYVASGEYVCGDFTYEHLYVGTTEVAPTPYYTLLDGACMGPTPNPSARYFTASEVTTADLAAVTDTPDPTTGRYARRLYRSDDGFSLLASLYDTTLAQKCTPGPDAGAPCSPSVANGGDFNDSACTDRVVHVRNPGCAAPALASYLDIGDCTSRVVQLGAPAATPSPVYTFIANGSSFMCGPTSEQAGDTFFALGSEIVLPTSTRSLTALPGHRLQYIDHALDGASYRDPFVHDTSLDLDCGVSPDANDALRCLPRSDTLTTSDYYYTDPACTQLIHVVPYAITPCNPGLFDYGASYDFGACGLVPTLYTLAPSSYSGPLYYQSFSQPCTAVGPGATLYDVGPPIDPAAFAAATVVIDP